MLYSVEVNFEHDLDSDLDQELLKNNDVVIEGSWVDNTLPGVYFKLVGTKNDLYNYLAQVSDLDYWSDEVQDIMATAEEFF